MISGHLGGSGNLCIWDFCISEDFANSEDFGIFYIL